MNFTTVRSESGIEGWGWPRLDDDSDSLVVVIGSDPLRKKRPLSDHLSVDKEDGKLKLRAYPVSESGAAILTILSIDHGAVLRRLVGALAAAYPEHQIYRVKSIDGRMLPVDDQERTVDLRKSQ